MTCGPQDCKRPSNFGRSCCSSRRANPSAPAALIASAIERFPWACRQQAGDQFRPVGIQMRADDILGQWQLGGSVPDDAFDRFAGRWYGEWGRATRRPSLVSRRLRGFVGSHVTLHGVSVRVDRRRIWLELSDFYSFDRSMARGTASWAWCTTWCPIGPTVSASLPAGGRVRRRRPVDLGDEPSLLSGGDRRGLRGAERYQITGFEYEINSAKVRITGEAFQSLATRATLPNVHPSVRCSDHGPGAVGGGGTKIATFFRLVFGDGSGIQPAADEND